MSTPPTFLMGYGQLYLLTFYLYTVHTQQKINIQSVSDMSTCKEKLSVDRQQFFSIYASRYWCQTAI